MILFGTESNVSNKHRTESTHMNGPGWYMQYGYNHVQPKKIHGIIFQHRFFQGPMIIYAKLHFLIQNSCKINLYADMWWRFFWQTLFVSLAAFAIQGTVYSYVTRSAVSSLRTPATTSRHKTYTLQLAHEKFCCFFFLALKTSARNGRKRDNQNTTRNCFRASTV